MFHLHPANSHTKKTDDSINESTKTTTTTDNDNEINPPAKCLKQIDDSNIYQTEETKHDLADNEESEDLIVKEYLKNFYFYENECQRLIKFNSLFTYDQEKLRKTIIVHSNSSINILRKSILTNLYKLYENDQWNLSTLTTLSTLFDNSINHYLEAELLIILYISQLKIDNVTKVEDIIKNLLPILRTEQIVVEKEFEINLNIIDEFKRILLTNQIIRIIQNVYSKLTKKQINTNDLQQIINDIHIEFVDVGAAYQLRGFSGRKKIYVNFYYILFHYKYDYLSPPSELLQLDLLTLMLHQTMHIILCERENNYNLSTLIDYAEVNKEESNTYIEKYIFTCCPDW
ncbi:unnamed protein product, partial [Rotaria sp. Silwood1]